MPTPVSRFMNLREAETEREQPVLLAYRPGAREIKALTQPQHGLEPPDRSSCRVEGLKAADPRHRPLDPEVVALDPLLQVFADVMQRISQQEPLFPGCRDGRRIRASPVCADAVGREQGLILDHLAEETLGSVQVALRRQQEVNG